VWPSCGHSFFLGSPKNPLKKDDEEASDVSEGVESKPKIPKRCFICSSPDLSKEIDFKAILR